MHSLLSHLPLLRPGNAEAKAEYLKIIPKVLEHSIENGCDIEESRQLLSYSLIHPAINGDERNQLTLWLGQLEERVTSSAALTTNTSSTSAGTFYQQQGGRAQDLSDLSQVMAYTDNNPPPAVSSSQNGVTNALYSVAGQQHVSGVNGWQQQQSLNGPSDSDHGVLSTASTTTGVGRAIKAASNTTSVVNTNASNSCISSSSTLIPHHTPLHATTSGPPAFNSSQGKVEFLPTFWVYYFHRISNTRTCTFYHQVVLN